MEKHQQKMFYSTYITRTEMEFISQVKNQLVGKKLTDNIVNG
jgi:hypothetical protein